jgi:hypothetical protein
MAAQEPQFVYYVDEQGVRRHVRPEDVDSVPDNWTPEDDKPAPKAAAKKSSKAS